MNNNNKEIFMNINPKYQILLFNDYVMSQGKKVIHLGDSYYSRGSSVASINSNSSNG